MGRIFFEGLADHTSAKKGEVLKVITDGTNFKVSFPEGYLNITEQLGQKDRMYIAHIGLALAVYDGAGGLEICEYFSYHTHTKYSILDGMNEVGNIAKLSSGISAISEHGNMFSFLEWQKAMEKNHKHPVFAFEAYVEDADEALIGKSIEEALGSTLEGEKNGSHLVLIAMDDEGLRNLFSLTTEAYYNFHKKPHISLESLKAHSKGVACTSACISGEIAKLLRDNDYEGAKKVAEFYKAIFGEDYYLEIQRHFLECEESVNKNLIRLSKELDIKLIAANDSHWEKEEDELAHDYLLCVRSKDSINNPNHPTFDGDGYEYFSDHQMIDRFWDMPETIKSGLELASKCTARVVTGEYHTPKYPLPEGYQSEEEYLTYLANKGFREKYGEGTEELRNRFSYELSVVLQMGYAGYFLIVWDYVSWAKSQGIYVGPGRGSAVGSVLSYCLDITNLEPTKYGLMFERFLNPERVSMPDIDVDFQHDRRPEVIEYVKGKYGADCVCNIITFGTMAAKLAVKDIARCQDEYALGNEIARMVEESTLSKALKTPELEAAYTSRPEVKKVVDMAKKLEGMPRQTSVHACGVVISDQPIRNYMPMAMVKDTKAEEKGLPKDTRMLCTQVTMAEVEELGCLKMDFLGLRNMTVLSKAISYINSRRRAEGLIEIGDYRQLPLNNPYVFKEISKGTTQALFQIESEGMRKLMREMFGDVSDRITELETQYSCKGFLGNYVGSEEVKAEYLYKMSELGDELFERMIAAISLYRPGPMDYIPDYEKGLRDSSAITYDTPELEPILKSTYGVMVYQEQVMQTVKALAGFSNAQADTIRKAMGKKKQAILDEYEPYFLFGSGDAIDEHTGKPLNIRGCVPSGVSEEVAKSVWDKMKDFAKYAFNKSHAAGYAVITVSCAWLKTYYPAEYMAAALNSYIDNNKKLSGYLSSTKKMGIKILPPSINKSEQGFKVENGSIRFGLEGIKGLSKSVSAVIREREQNGDYTSLQNFMERVPEVKNVDKLVKAGCFDEFGYSRNALCEAIKDIKKDIKNKAKQTSGQMSMFDELGVTDEATIDNLPEWDMAEKLQYEKEVTDLYLSEHPLDRYADILNSCSEISLIEESGDVTIGAIITDFNVRYTKKDNRPMASVTFEDQGAEIKGVIFPDDYTNLFHLLEKNKLVVVKGTVEYEGDYGTQIIVKTILPIEDLKSDKTVTKIFVLLENAYQFGKLENILNEYPGDCVVMAQCQNQLFRMNSTANACSALLMELQNNFADVSIK